MKKTIIAVGLVAGLLLAGCSGKNQEAGKMKTLEDSASYAIGFQTAKNLQQQDFVLNPTFVEKGILDADTTKGKALFTDEQLRGVAMQLQERLKVRHMEKMKVQAEKNKTEGPKFLAENKAKQGVVTTTSGLQYKILAPGSGAKPKMSQVVGLRFNCKTIDGKEVDNSNQYGGMVSVPVGAVNKGWTEALQLMSVGSKWQIVVPAELGFGDRAPYPTVAPNAVLIYELELMAIEPAGHKK
ncbi:MAG: FKBP-type peptidyl-prolyl cis-trans isomerase [Ignavibacteriales bacterium]|nr:FKBP-type peptidyl-prolyl cis-trans isomerase [Ignavibacteriales bacterium]